MKDSGRNTRVAVAIVASALLHGVGVWLFYVLTPPDLKERVFRVRVPVRRMAIERLRVRAPVPVPHPLLERLRATGGPPALEVDVGVGEMAPLPEIGILVAEERPPLAQEEKRQIEGELDSLDARLVLWEQSREFLQAADLVELDAERRRRTIVLIDPDTGKLKKAYLHMPCYRNRPLGYSGGRELSRIVDMIERHRRLPSSAPLEFEIHWYDLGLGSGWWDPSDPIHSFGTRNRLAYQEAKEYPFLAMRYIDVASTEVMVRYLMEGGFAVVTRAQFAHLERQLAKQVGDRLEVVQIGLGHPLFHAYYDITEYRDGNRTCPAVRPLPGLQLDGRLIAVTGVPLFHYRAPCPGNQLYVNAIAYGLTQPSRMGGRYLARKSNQPRD